MAQKQCPLELLFGCVLSPFEEFLHRTTAGGIVLIAATVVAFGLAWLFLGAKSPGAPRAARSAVR